MQLLLMHNKKTAVITHHKQRSRVYYKYGWQQVFFTLQFFNNTSKSVLGKKQKIMDQLSVKQSVFVIVICLVVSSSLAQTQMKCAHHEHMDECGAMCELTCVNPHPRACSVVCSLDLPACACNNGYVRNINGTCILPQACPS